MTMDSLIDIFQLFYQLLMELTHFNIIIGEFTYTVSVSLGHAYYFFPYISDTGAEQPESGIFGYILNISAVLYWLIIYVRYKQVYCVQKTLSLKFSKFWNETSFVIGLLACFGMNMVANFPKLDMLSTHNAGAGLYFTCTIIYFLIQTKISYHFVDLSFGIGRSTFMIRLFLSIIIIPLYISCGWFAIMARDQFTGTKINYCTPNDGGYTNRLISTFSQWLVACVMISYILTFAREFRYIQFKSAIRLKSD